MKVPVTGGIAATLASPLSPSRIAVDATSLHWVNGGNYAAMKLTPK